MCHQLDRQGTGPNLIIIMEGITYVVVFDTLHTLVTIFRSGASQLALSFLHATGSANPMSTAALIEFRSVRPVRPLNPTKYFDINQNVSHPMP